MCECYRGGIVVTDVNTLMKVDLFVLSCARVRRVRRGRIELIMCGGGVRSIFYCLLWIYA